jgi:HEAT repeat protein
MRCLVVGLALLAGAAAAEPPLAAPTPAAESTDLFAALESAPLVVVGTIAGRTALDAQGWRANVVVESTLVGAAAPGAPLVIAWEELAASRPPRFGNGDRVLLALEPLTAGSLWRQRFGDPKALLAARGIAQQGSAFLRAPSLGSTTLLEHYLLMPAEIRDGPAGERLLIALAADAERPLAVSAATRLTTLTGEATLGVEEAQDVLRALARADSDAELAAPLLIWIERRQPVGLAPALDAALAAPTKAPATFVQARGVLGEGLAPERARALLASKSAAHRAATAGVSGPDQAGRLAQLVRSDPAPEVRLAALRRLAQLRGPASLDTVLQAFDDENAEVRNEAALLAAAFGPTVVPRLREVADGWPWPASQTAVVALRSANSPESTAALVHLADEHPDERVRTMAAVALGRGIGHRD